MSGSVPHHEHITVDEETYWGLMYLHIELRKLIKEGRVTDPVLLLYSSDAERRLEQSRRWNAADPEHSLLTGDPDRERRCTCGPDGTVDECDREVAAGGWCPNRGRLNRHRAAHRSDPSA